jgi:hypothetical protein
VYVRIKILLASKCAQAKLKEKVVSECEIERIGVISLCMHNPVYSPRSNIEYKISDMERESGWEKGIWKHC